MSAKSRFVGHTDRNEELEIDWPPYTSLTTKPNILRAGILMVVVGKPGL